MSASIAPSLQGFLHWLDAGEHRGQARPRERARRGAHHDRARRQGARGADRVPARHDAPQTARDAPTSSWRDGDGRSRSGSPRKARTATSPACARRARKRAREAQEYRRLLYVALTRAEDRLYRLRLAEAERDAEARLLVRAVRAGLRSRAEPVAFDRHADRRTVGRSCASARQTAAASRHAAPMRRGPLRCLPGWVAAAAAARAEAAAAARAVAARGEEPPARLAAGERPGPAFKRGRLIHRLLQTCPNCRPQRAPRRRRAFSPPARRSRRASGGDRAEVLGRARRTPTSPRCAGRAAWPRSPIVGRSAQAADRRPDRPAGGDGGAGADPRLQDQPAAAASAGARCRRSTCSRWRPTARRFAASIPAARSLRPALDRRPAADAASRRPCSTPQPCVALRITSPCASLDPAFGAAYLSLTTNRGNADSRLAKEDHDERPLKVTDDYFRRRRPEGQRARCWSISGRSGAGPAR